MHDNILYGYHPVREVIRAGRRKVLEVYLSKGRTTSRAEKVISLAQAIKVPVHRITAEKMTAMTRSESNQGVCAVVGPFIWSDLDRLKTTDENGGPLLLLLDQVLDPHNLGALIRTAYCAGVNGLILTKDRSAQPTPAVCKASAGAMEHLPLTRVTNMVSTIKTLKASGIWIAGLDKENGQNVYKSDLTGPLALVIGGEEKGLRPLVRKHCDLLASIPQEGAIDSLNASVAGGVVIYEAYRQRKT